MAKAFQLDKFKSDDSSRDQYRRQLKRLAGEGKSVDCIEQAVRE